MKVLSRQEQWEQMLDFYQDLIDRSHWPIKCMQDLVQSILKDDISKKYYPSTSHSSLGISIEFEYKFRLVKPMVYVLCDETVENYIVSFQEGQGRTNFQKYYKIAEMNIMLTEIDKWLENA